MSGNLAVVRTLSSSRVSHRCFHPEFYELKEGYELTRKSTWAKWRSAKQISEINLPRRPGSKGVVETALQSGMWVRGERKGQTQSSNGFPKGYEFAGRSTWGEGVL